jgi:hypothetical protein
MIHNTNKNAFCVVNNKKWRKWCISVLPFLFVNTYGLPELTEIPAVQIKFFMFDLSNYIPFVLKRGWKRVFLQIMLFVHVCRRWGIVEQQTCFETWITRIDVNGVTLFNLSYSITLMAYLCSQLTPNVQIMYFIIDWC